ncbi:MAG: tetratricopeptide repeat protein [Candidatus Omnitrophota bacterium]|jgi:TolA-binding protein
MKSGKTILVPLVLLTALMVGFSSIGYCDAAAIRKSFKVYDTGKNYFDNGDYRRAVSQFEDVVGNYPETDLTEAAMYYLGKSYEKMDNNKQAISVYEALIKRFRRGYWVKSARDHIKDIRSAE